MELVFNQQSSRGSAEAEWRVRHFRDRDKDGLLRLSADHFGEKEPGQEAYFDWLYQGGPAGGATLVVCEELESGDIVGFTYYVPLHVKVGDRYDVCYLGCNALIRPDYRQTGVFSQLNNLVYQNERDVAFLYGFPKPDAVVAHQMAGKFVVASVPLLVRPLDMRRLTETRESSVFVKWLMNLGWMVAGHTIWRPRIPRSSGHNIDIVQEPHFDDRFDRFWQRVAGKYAINVRRDCAFLAWRFRSSGFRQYEILTAQTAGDMLGYVVLRQTEVDGVASGLIMDFLVEDSARGSNAGRLLVAEASRRFQASGMALGGCLILPNTHEAGLLREAGYLNVPARFAPQEFRIMTKSLAPRVSDEFLQRQAHWFVTAANHDAV